MSHPEYEVIAHSRTCFRVFLVNLLYRTPHIHRDFEVSSIINGPVDVSFAGNTRTLHPGDLLLVNPYESHELKADGTALILSLQVSPNFFTSFFPEIESICFRDHWLTAPPDKEAGSFFSELLEIANTWFHQEELYELKCMTLISRLFYRLFRTAGYYSMTERELKASEKKAHRMRKMIRFIDAHYSEKLLLSDLAEEEELNLHYLSHFFKDVLGMTFQKYLSSVRCEHARQQLLLTDLPLLDISIGCGFSDPKYLNRDFRGHYGCTPREYRKSFKNAALSKQQKSILSTQEFLSEKAALITLDRLSAAESPSRFL